MPVRLRLLTAAVLVAVMSLAIALPAAATVWKSGTKYCGTNWTPWVRSYSTGFTEHYPPGPGYQSYSNGSSWIVRKTYSTQSGGGGVWIVFVTDGSLSDSGTYAGCDQTGGS
jgi:hypothetical protein